MKPRLRLLVLAGFIGAVGLVSLAARSFYLAPREKLLAQIEQSRRAVRDLEERTEDRPRVVKRLRELAAGTLGKQQDLFEHRLRTGLNRVGERAGLASIEINHGSPAPAVNPLTTINQKNAGTSLRRALRGKPDFLVVRAQIKGEGTIEAALETIATLQAQPWIQRVEGFTLRPRGPGGRFELRVDVASLFAPDLASADSPEPVIAPPTARHENLWRAVLAKNVFMPLPKADERASAPAHVLAVTPLPPPRAPYEEYRLTGVVKSSQGVVAFLLNTRSGERITLLPGGRVLDAVLVDGSGERAVFEITGQRYEILNGNSLAARRQIAIPVHSATTGPGGF